VARSRGDLQREQLYPWQAGASFACSDAELNRIFQAGVRTVQLCSHGAFIDSPTREQRAWVGDPVVHQMVHLATNCDWRLAWHDLTLANSPRADGLLAWAKESVPTPHGLITIAASADAVMVDAPVPVVVELEGQSRRMLSVGRHELSVR
jgi:Bacterial alpha-L-rhamnosidase 6 hairpin glycosidase domain